MNKQLILSFRVLALGALGTGIFLYYQHVSGLPSGLPQATKTIVSVTEQTGSPLRVLPTYFDSSNAEQPLYGYSVTNLTDKPIAAYAIVEDVSLGGGPLAKTTVLTHFPSVNSLFRPHESRQEEGGSGTTYKGVPTQVILSVDFVEFVNGVRWGDDTGHSSDKLDGKRAGGKATIKKYREIIAVGGLSALERAMAAAELAKPESDSRSAAWEEGFRIGVNTVKYRVKEAKLRGGESETKRELQKPFDSADGRIDP